MSVAEEFDRQLRRYLQREISLDDLFRWLAGHVQAIAFTDDEALKDREADVWLKIDEVDHGAATEDEFRRWAQEDLAQAVSTWRLEDMRTDLPQKPAASATAVLPVVFSSCFSPRARVRPSAEWNRSRDPNALIAAS